MKKTKKKIELPLVEPLYSTYHYQGPGTATLVNNPSIRNWYLNQVMILTCTRKFLNGFTTPQIRMQIRILKRKSTRCNFLRDTPIL